MCIGSCLALVGLALALLAACKPAAGTQAPVTLRWEMGQTEVEPRYYENSFVLKNISDRPLGREWSIYFSQLPRRVKQTGNPTVVVESVNGNYFKMYPTEAFEPLAPGDSLRITFRATIGINRNSQAPEGTYWVPSVDGATGRALPVELTAMPLPNPESLKGYPDARRIYSVNEQLAQAPAPKAEEILPSVKRVRSAQGEVVLEGKVALRYDRSFASEAALLHEKLTSVFGLEVADEAPVTITLSQLQPEQPVPNDEYYAIYMLTPDQIQLTATTPHGIFNATRSLLAMLKGQQAPYRLACMTVEDWPDLGYRGLMMDISRNFISSDDLKRLVDILASYKLNRLHFHFCDDEGWRLEIPGLEELTEVGGRRGHTVDELTCLYPGYAGNPDPTAATVDNGFYTREEFIDLLKYAAQRHVKVIPEIESPGHARAAIVAMKARYHRYAATDKAKAEEYLLSEPADTSRYMSVQYYDDNALNVALPSTYRFMEKVVKELVAMYAEAGVELPAIHLGGDEVAAGVWMGSPACQQLMQEKGMTKKHDLAEYFITRMAGILQAQGVKMSGWQEVALGHSEEGHNLLRPLMDGVYCWNTLGASAEVVYQTANNGYPVILCNVGNFYMDLAYSYHPDERGLNWGGCVDESISFSMLPYSIYRSRRVDATNNTPVDLKEASKGKTALTEEGRKFIVGVQGQLFSETIRSYDWVEYYLFPKLLGLAERGWNPHTSWEALQGAAEQKAFDEALAGYYAKISFKEMPWWSACGVNFRLPHPGLKVEDGMLWANSSIRGAEVRYTLDGSEPTAQSPLWTEPVPCEAAKVRAATFYLGKQSIPVTLSPAQ